MQQFVHSPNARHVEGWADLGQGHEHEVAFGDTGMRQGQRSFVAASLTVHEQVEIDEAWPLAHDRGFAPEPGFERLQFAQQRGWIELRQQRGGSVDEIGLFDRPHGTRAIG